MISPDEARSCLVVDDSDPVRRIVAEEIRYQGYSVVEAVNGSEARSLLAGRYFDLIVTDVSMPHNGSMLFRWTLLARPEAALVMMSGNAILLPTDPVSSQAVLLAKPFSPMQLRDAIVSAFEKRDERIRLMGNLDSDPEIACILSPGDRVWLVNESWRRFALENDYGVDPKHDDAAAIEPDEDACGVGRSYVDVCKNVARSADRVYAQRALEQILHVRRGRSGEPFVYPCHSPEKERWFEMASRPVHLGVLELVRIRHRLVEAGP